EAQREVHRRRETLVPLLTEEIPVRGTEELAPRRGTEQPAEGTREQERPHPGLLPLARDVDQHDLEEPATLAARSDDEVPRERLAVRGPQHGVDAPVGWQRWDAPVRLEPVPQVDDHEVSGHALQPQPVARAD